MVQVAAEYLAAGANRHPSASDWNIDGLLAYGADRNIALWEPQSQESRGVTSLLSGHTDTVNAVKFIPESDGLLLSGSVDKTLRLWKRNLATQQYSCIQILEKHDNSINCIAVCSRSPRVFVSGSADANVNVWRLAENDVASLQQKIQIKPRFFPLSLALSTLAGTRDSYVLAVAGTKDIVQLYVLDNKTSPDFILHATLSGHEGWIRSLEFTQETFNPTSDLILASASQDKYIRLWRIHQGQELPAAAASADPSLGAFMPGKSLSNKAHRFRAQDLDFSATFEALLLGHDDWIYSTRWRAVGNKIQLLSASADNSLAIWEPDTSTGVWVTTARLGEISSEKGSTTATGSTGGFWSGLWSPSGETVVSLARTGSWRLWNHDLEHDRWVQSNSISGHTSAVTAITWSRDGDYLLSTSLDQTTRLHAKWIREQDNGTLTSWHEFSRPQIHGYDLNCLASLGSSSFVSGAEEKLLRVFDLPKAVSNLLLTLCGVDFPSSTKNAKMSDAANMPVLGLSNKAIEAVDDDVEIQPAYHTDREAFDPASVVHKSTLDLRHPPLEDHLARHTLWPESEKLYGHGYEISCLATSHDGLLVATACKASSIDHAVIRLFETTSWHEIKPPLTAHNLTVTSLAFSHDDAWLLSVGRDRQWAVFSRDTERQDVYTLKENNPKGHSRMILDCAWLPNPQPVFATAGRDKSVKIWGRSDVSSGFACKVTISEDAAVTAVDFLDKVIGGKAYLAIGTETGRVKVYAIKLEDFAVAEVELSYSSTYLQSTKTISQLAWRPTKKQTSKENEVELCIASEDSSIRLYSLQLPTNQDA